MFLASLILFAGCGEKTPPPPLDPRPNILIVLVDTLRADHLSAYGYHRETSPNIDRLAAEGVLFENAFSPSSFTRESVAALFTGKYPSSNPWGGGWLASPDPDAPILAKLFQKQGYQTAMFFNNPIINKDIFKTGFDHAKLGREQVYLSGGEEDLSHDALAHLDTLDKNKPFLLYAHYLDPHSPYEPDDRFYYKFADEKFPNPIPLIPSVRGHIPKLVAEGFGPGDPRFDDLVLRYDAEIRAVDEAIGVLLDGIRARGLYENTVIVLLSDHGQEFLEHDFVEHCWDLRRESVHVPLIFHIPGRSAPERITHPVSIINTMPTLLQFAGIPIPGGLDAYPLYEHGGWQVREDVPIFAELLVQSRLIMRMVQQGDYAYFAAPLWLDIAERSKVSLKHQEILRELASGRQKPRPVWGEPEREFLYNIHKDPLQQKDILEESPEIAEKYRQILREYQEQCPPARTEKEQRLLLNENEMTDEQREQLERLGYL